MHRWKGNLSEMNIDLNSWKIFGFQDFKGELGKIFSLVQKKDFKALEYERVYMSF